MVPRAGVEPARIAPLVFETSASTDSAIWARRATFAERERRKGDSNPRYGYPYDSLANCWFKPLTHLSCQLKLFLRSAEREKAAQRYDKYFTYAKIHPQNPRILPEFLHFAFCILHFRYNSTTSRFFGMLRLRKPTSCRWSLNAACANGSPCTINVCFTCFGSILLLR